MQTSPPPRRTRQTRIDSYYPHLNPKRDPAVVLLITLVSLVVAFLVLWPWIVRVGGLGAYPDDPTGWDGQTRHGAQEFWRWWRAPPDPPAIKHGSPEMRGAMGLVWLVLCLPFLPFLPIALPLWIAWWAIQLGYGLYCCYYYWVLGLVY